MSCMSPGGFWCVEDLGELKGTLKREETERERKREECGWMDEQSKGDDGKQKRPKMQRYSIKVSVRVARERERMAQNGR